VSYRIIGGSLFDGHSATVIPDSEVEVSADLISYVGPRRGAAPAVDATYDARGCTVLPGLIDCHVHLTADATLKRDAEARSGLAALATQSHTYAALHATTRMRAMLAHGFTTVRDLLAPNEAIFELRDAVVDGTLDGPRIVASGKCVTVTGGHGAAYGADLAWEADNVDAIRRAVDTQAERGADVIKVMATTRSYVPPFRAGLAFDRDALTALVAAARDRGLTVAAHAQNAGADAVRDIVLAGVHTLEHGRPLDAETARIMADRGTYYVPTLAVRFTAKAALDRRDTLWPEQTWPMIPRQYEEALRGMEVALANNVRIALGTDAGVSGVLHEESARELEYLCQTGMHPVDALRAGTSLAAEACAINDDTGTLDRGKRADILVVRGDPTRNVTLLQQRDALRLIAASGRLAMNDLARAST